MTEEEKFISDLIETIERDLKDIQKETEFLENQISRKRFEELEKKKLIQRLHTRLELSSAVSKSE